MNIKKFVIALILIGTFLLPFLPNGLLASTCCGPPPLPTIHELIEDSELIVVVKPTEIKLGGKSRGRLAGSAKVQVLEVWKGSLEKKEFTIDWRTYNGVINYFVSGERVYGMARHILFLKRERRNRFFIGTVNYSSSWTLQKIQFPGVENKREAIAYQNSVSEFDFDGTGQVLLRDTATKQMKDGERVYRKAILLNELRLFVKEVLEDLEMKKQVVR